MIPLPRTLKTRAGISLTVLWFVLLFTLCNSVIAKEEKIKLREITPEELKLIIGKHQEWLKVYDTLEKRATKKAGNDPRRANLRDTDLTKAKLWKTNLANANLSNANLTQANLGKSNLTNAILKNADLTQAYLGKANLVKVMLKGANLTQAELIKANLTQAYLEGANLNQTILEYADLTEAYLGKANLTNANLLGANLSRAELSEANLNKAYLGYAKLIDTNLVGANLIKADLKKADLTNANLLGANLTQAYLEEANLTKAFLLRANLTNSYLWEANLTQANLSEVDLSEASLVGANITNVIFEPNNLPPTNSIAYTKNLHTLVYKSIPIQLVSLRKTFKEAGYREQERAITHAINQSGLWRDKSLFGKTESWFKYIFLSLPTQWGMYPGRAIRILLAGIFVFMMFYLVALQASEPKAGIWKIRSKERVLDEDKTDKELIDPTGFWSAFGTAFYFSLLSAFHIGWRDLNVGSWINRIQFKEYTLCATGWVRAISGIQSLISVYLVAMWVLTYFGRPFG